MTHLENFLDSLKTLPNDLQRTFALVHELDNQYTLTSNSCHEAEEEILGMANHKILKSAEGGGGKMSTGAVPEAAITEPTVDQLFDVRTRQWKAFHLSNEKIALVDQATQMIRAFVSRLDEDLKKFEVQLGPDLPIAPLETPRRKLYEKRTKGVKHARSIDGEDLLSEAVGGGPLRKSNTLSSSRSMDALGGNTVPSVPSRSPSVSNLASNSTPTFQTRAPTGEAGGRSASGEPLYCTCQQVSFGEMVGCDDDDCRFEWFHLPCVGLKRPPKGQWFCSECRARREKEGL